MLGFTAESFEKHAIQFLEVFEHRLLVSVHAAPDGNQEELEMGCHGASKHSNPLRLNRADCIGRVSWEYALQLHSLRVTTKPRCK